MPKWRPSETKLENLVVHLLLTLPEGPDSDLLGIFTESKLLQQRHLTQSSCSLATDKEAKHCNTLTMVF